MQTLTLGLEWFLNPDHVPLLVAQEKGWFRQAGLELDVVVPDEHLDAVEEIREGRMDLAVTEPLHLVEDGARGEGVLGFARFLHTNGGVMYLAGNGIDRPRDMAGTRIQYPGAPGPGGPAIVATMVEADGGRVDPDAFGRVDNSFYHTDALADGVADVATLVFYNFEVLEARHRGFDARFFALKDWGVPDFCQLVLITTRDVMARRSGELEAFLGILQRGLDFVHQHPGEARDIYGRRAEEDLSDDMNRAIFRATVPCFTYDLSMAPGYFEKLGGWMEAWSLVAKSPDPADVWTNDLAL